MDINEFVATSLRQIVNGVKQAQESTRLPDKHPTEADIINPKIMYTADHAPKGKYFATQERNLVHFVQFDIAVTIESGSNKINVVGNDAATAASSSGKETVASRIKFEVPLAFPRSAD